ncbi:hypothetical protein Lal_00014156 [Lupinus albus]|nr:hypothetical protein Lal_00014156 [Lupinus albus]
MKVVNGAKVVHRLWELLFKKNSIRLDYKNKLARVHAENSAAKISRWSVKSSNMLHHRNEQIIFSMIKLGTRSFGSSEIEEELVSMLQVGLTCVAPQPDKRPTMAADVKMIEDIRVEQSPLGEDYDESRNSLSPSLPSNEDGKMG